MTADNKEGKLIDAEGKTLHEGDRVYAYDICDTSVRIYGTLLKNTDYPHVSEWYVKYDDGEEFAVLDFNFIWKGTPEVAYSAADPHAIFCPIKAVFSSIISKS